MNLSINYFESEHMEKLCSERDNLCRIPSQILLSFVLNVRRADMFSIAEGNQMNSVRIFSRNARLEIWNNVYSRCQNRHHGTSDQQTSILRSTTKRWMQNKLFRDDTVTSSFSFSTRMNQIYEII